MTNEERHTAVLNRMLESMDVYDSIQPTTERKKAIKAAIKALEQQPIPDNATNGDVIDAMFPNVDFVTDVFGGFNFPKWWWNASYQKGGKE